MVLNLGPYLVDYSQTVNELLVVKSLQDRNWALKSKLNKLFILMTISPIGPLVIVIKKLLRLLQGVSILSIELVEFVTNTK